MTSTHAVAGGFAVPLAGMMCKSSDTMTNDSYDSMIEDSQRLVPKASPCKATDPDATLRYGEHTMAPSKIGLPTETNQRTTGPSQTGLPAETRQRTTGPPQTGLPAETNQRTTGPPQTGLPAETSQHTTGPPQTGLPAETSQDTTGLPSQQAPVKPTAHPSKTPVKRKASEMTADSPSASETPPSTIASKVPRPSTRSKSPTYWKSLDYMESSRRSFLNKRGCLLRS